MLNYSRDGATTADLAKDAGFMATGFTPSGKALLHDGHKLTLMHALLPLDRHPHLFADVFIDDCEYSNQSDPRLPRPDAVRTMRASITDFSVQLSKYVHNAKLPRRVRIRTMTEFFREAGLEWETMGAELMSLLQESRGVLRETFAQTFNGNKRKLGPTRPICPDCGLGWRTSARVEQKGLAMETTCPTYDCPTERYSVDPAAGATNWAVHYAVVSLMNLLVTRQYDSAAVEVLGGDYALEWGSKGRPIAERLSETVARIKKPGTPDFRYFIGQLLCTDEGRKVSKSHGDGDAEAPDFDALLALMSGRDAVVTRTKV